MTRERNRLMMDCGEQKTQVGGHMTHEDQSHGEQADEQDRPHARQRGGSPSAIAGALHRTPHPGPQHWGGPRPRRVDPDPFFPNRLGPPPKRRRP